MSYNVKRWIISLYLFTKRTICFDNCEEKSHYFALYFQHKSCNENKDLGKAIRGQFRLCNPKIEATSLWISNVMSEVNLFVSQIKWFYDPDDNRSWHFCTKTQCTGVMAICYSDFSQTQKWQYWHYWQLSIPIYLQCPSLFAPYDGSECKIRYQWEKQHIYFQACRLNIFSSFQMTQLKRSFS